jgi:hypothetical protein
VERRHVFGTNGICGLACEFAVVADVPIGDRLRRGGYRRPPRSPGCAIAETFLGGEQRVETDARHRHRIADEPGSDAPGYTEQQGVCADAAYCL